MGSLKVKCHEHNKGCEWQGELRDMKVHNDVCKKADKEEGMMKEELRNCREELRTCREELDSLKEKAKEVDVLKEKVMTAERLITKQQWDIQDLAGKVEQLQRVAAQKENCPPTTSLCRRKRGESSGACANPRGAEKEGERKRKGGGHRERERPDSKRWKRTMNLLHHAGHQKYVKIDNSDKSVKFCTKFNLTSVIGCCEPVSGGHKVWYEISIQMIGDVSVGWSFENHIAPEGDFYEIGDDDKSYGFRIKSSVTLRMLNHEYRFIELTDEKIRKIATEDISCIGVALDMVKGEILFSVNGKWLKDKFNNVPLDVKFLPAITGSNNAAIEVNFGEKEFMYAPPDSTFQSMIDIL